MVNMRKIEEFPLSRRARAAVVRFCKNGLPPVPGDKVYKAPKKYFFGRGKEERFEFQPRGWVISEIAVKRGRVYINLYLDWRFIRSSDKSELYYQSSWNLSSYGLEKEERGFGELHLGLDTGVQVLPINPQQAKFLLGKKSGEIWGISPDLEEL